MADRALEGASIVVVGASRGLVNAAGIVAFGSLADT
jgi:hypothetical protein